MSGVADKGTAVAAGLGPVGQPPRLRSPRCCRPHWLGREELADSHPPYKVKELVGSDVCVLPAAYPSS